MSRRNLQWMLSVGALCAGLTIMASAQQDPGPVQGNAGQASQPAGVTSSPGNASGSPTSPAPSEGTSTVPTGRSTNPPPAPNTDAGSARTDKATPNTDSKNPRTETATPTTDPTVPTGTTAPKPNNSAAYDDNPYNPLSEVPALPKGNTTLVGGTATGIDHVRNRLTLQPFGGGPKMKMVLDERSHVYRNGAETTVLGIHKGDRVYADTMLDNGKVFARNVRVVTEPGSAEVRGQVTGTNPSKGTITLRDELSSQAVTFEVSNNTRYSAFRGTASSADVKPGSLIDVQFAPQRSRDVAQEIIVLAKPGDAYIFAGTVTHLDMRTGTLAVENRTDEQTYEVHFNPASLDDRSQLQVGSEVTTHAVFDGKQYKAEDLQVQKATAQEQQGKEQ